MKVLVCDKLDEQSLNKMKNAGLEVDYKTGMSPDQVKSAVPGYDIMVVRSNTKVTKDIIDAAPNLKLIVRPGVGIDNIDAIYAKEKRIEIRNTTNATTASVAEHVLGLMIAIARSIPQEDHLMKTGVWNRKNHMGTELMGKTLGLIGLGRIGQEVAKRASVFGMKLTAYDPVANPAVAEKLEILLIGLDDLLKSSDFISLHVPLAPETRHMIDAPALAKMKKGAYLINSSRGGIVEEEALANAIKEGHIRGAAFDVFEKEPPSPDNPLLKLNQFICAPHVGASTEEAQERACQEVARIIIDFAKSKSAR